MSEDGIRKEYVFLDLEQPWRTEFRQRLKRKVYDLITDVNVWTDCNFNRAQKAWTCDGECKNIYRIVFI